MSVDIDESLREQSKLLLRKLKDRQGKLQNIVNVSTVSSKNGISTSLWDRELQDDPQSATNLKEAFDTSLKKTVNKPSMKSKERLQKLTKTKQDKERVNYMSTRLDNKENLKETYGRKSLKSKEVDMTSASPVSRERNLEVSGATEMDVLKEIRADVDSLGNDVKEESETYAKNIETPNTVRRRKIIDKNIRVGGTANLNESEIMRECEEEFPRLNFSYSNVDDSDLKYLQSRFGSDTNPKGAEAEIPVHDSDPEETKVKGYSQRLENPGNSRRIAKFIRETGKPKSILLSTSQRQNKSSSNKVSFRSPTSRSSTDLTYQMDPESVQKQRMLGYDWIAALIENDSNAVNQSETFFDELREFRRTNLEECVNKMYMDGPQELWEHPEREPPEVQKALEETKVKPYIVNDRLFSEPIKRDMFAQYDYDENDRTREKKEKEPTYDEPRFVRVSIPRSTLASPHRVKPHRRKSFDNSDTMALSEHCLMGWNTSQPSMMPAASNIGLRDSTLGIQSSLKTTLDQAEKLAANYPYRWDPSEQKISRPLPKLTPRPESAYMDSTWPYSTRTNQSAFSSASQGLQQATDELLNSTYSLMYEMERLKNERSSDPLRV